VPEFRVGAVVLQDGEHPCHQVIDGMAVERPKPGIVGIEGDGYLRACGNHNGVMQSAGKLLAIDLHNLKIMPMEMQGMGP
jgi:hypothetical protein